MGIIEGFKSVVSFLTIIPSKNTTIEEIAFYAYLFPIVGAIIGAINGIIGYILFQFVPSIVAATLTLFFILLLTGLHHLDGVLDLGDALMFKGSREERLRILHDKHHGVGGIFALYLILSLTLSAIISMDKKIFPNLIVAECLAKLSLLMLGCFGTPHTQGIGRIFILKIKEKKQKNIILGIFFSLIITYIVVNKLVIYIFIFNLFFLIIWLKFLTYNFGCITGDMLGATNEISRVLYLLLIIALGG